MPVDPTAPVPGPVTEPVAGRPPRNWRGWLLLMLVLPVACWVFYEAQRTFRADWASAAVRQKVLAWVAGNGLPADQAEWDAAQAALQKSLDLMPDDPDMVERMGDLHAVAGLRDWTDETKRRAHYARAASYYEASIALRPGAPQTWAMLAASRQAMGAPRASVHEAWAKARRLGPYEGHVQPILMQVVLADWQGAVPAMQDWAKDLFDQGDEGTRRDINAMAKPYGLHFAPDPPAAPASAAASASAATPSAP